MTRLIEASGASLRSLLPAGRDLPAWHAALTDEISRHLSPDHAALLAHPERTAAGMAWDAPGNRTRYADLSAESRRALDAALGAILSDIRRLAESGVAPAVREAWPALRELPDLGHLFAVDGRPVLAAWGHASTGAPDRLARLDDGVRWRATPRPPWPLYGAALAVLALLALAAGLLLPRAANLLVAAPNACAIVPGQLDAMAGQMREENRTEELRTLLAALTEEVGRKQLLCPIRVAPQAAAPPVIPVPPVTPVAPPAPPRADLPRERWDQRDLSMFEGCWNLYTTLFVFNGDRTRRSGVSSWRMCFDRGGVGTQNVALEDGRRCTGPLAAAFDNEVFRVSEPSQCTGPALDLGRSERLCRRLGDTEADCAGRNLGGSRPGSSYNGRFRR